MMRLIDVAVAAVVAAVADHLVVVIVYCLILSLIALLVRRP